MLSPMGLNRQSSKIAVNASISATRRFNHRKVTLVMHRHFVYGTDLAPVGVGWQSEAVEWLRSRGFACRIRSGALYNKSSRARKRGNIR